MIRVRRTALGVGLLLILARGTSAAPPDVAIMPPEEYRSAAARSLATTYTTQLQQIYDNVYHCLPWLDIKERGLGFRKPRGAQGGDFYLSIWVWVEQVANPQFAAMLPARRASAMFSRYGVDLLRRLSSYPALAAEAGLAGYAVVLSWQKPDGATRPVAETLAVFVDKATLQGFFRGTITPAELADRAVVAAFDGKSALGRLALEIWEDSFAKTFRLQDYTPDPSHRC